MEAVVDRVDALGWLTVKRIGRQLPRALQPAAISNDDSWAMEQETMLDLEPIRELLSVLQQLPGFTPDLVLKRLPRLVREPDARRMGAQMAKGLAERGVVRLVKVAAGIPAQISRTPSGFGVSRDAFVGDTPPPAAQLAAGLGVSLAGVGGVITTPALAAKDVALVSGAFRRSLSVDDLAYLAETGKPRGLMVDILRLSNQNPEDVAKLLNQELNLPLVLTSRLMSTRIGDVIIRRVARIIYPLMVPSPDVSVPAIRAGVINGLQIDDGGLTAIKFLKAYPAEVMEVNIPALMAVIEKRSQSQAWCSSFPNHHWMASKMPNPET